MTTEQFPGITFTWEFPRFSAHPNLNGMTNVIYNVEYILSATDGEGHGSQYFSSVGLGEPDPEVFKKFNLITQDAVPRVGINKDAPTVPLDVVGAIKSNQLSGQSNEL